MSVAMEICRIAEAQVGTAAAPTITRVGVVVGDDSGLERTSLEFCLETLLDHPPFHHARLELVATSGDELRLDYLEVDDGRTSD